MIQYFSTIVLVASGFVPVFVTADAGYETVTYQAHINVAIWSEHNCPK